MHSNVSISSSCFSQLIRSVASTRSTKDWIRPRQFSKQQCYNPFGSGASQWPSFWAIWALLRLPPLREWRVCVLLPVRGVFVPSLLPRLVNYPHHQPPHRLKRIPPPRPLRASIFAPWAFSTGLLPLPPNMVANARASSFLVPGFAGRLGRPCWGLGCICRRPITPNYAGCAFASTGINCCLLIHQTELKATPLTPPSHSSPHQSLYCINPTTRRTTIRQKCDASQTLASPWHCQLLQRHSLPQMNQK